MPRIKGNKTTFTASINTELYNKLSVRANTQGVSFSYMLQVCASIGCNVLEGKNTQDAVQSAVRAEMLPALELFQQTLNDIDLSKLLKGGDLIGTEEEKHKKEISG